MITEDYVSFETAKLLKEKGFDAEAYKYYHIWDGPNRHPIYDSSIVDNSEAPHLYIPAPTLQMAMKWLREVHNIIIEICLGGYYMRASGDLYINSYEYKVWSFFRHLDEQGNTNLMWDDRMDRRTDFDSYEQACEAAIKYCLENLI